MTLSKPRAAQSLLRGSTFLASGARPLMPAPITVSGRRDAAEQRLDLIHGQAAGSGMNEVTSSGSNTSQSSAT